MKSLAQLIARWQSPSATPKDLERAPLQITVNAAGCFILTLSWARDESGGVFEATHCSLDAAIADLWRQLDEYEGVES